MKFKDLLLVDLLLGLWTTIKHFPRKKFTVQYPEKKLAVPQRFRGMFRLNVNTCLGCLMCQNACPIDIIHMEVHDETTPEGKKRKVVDRFDIDIKRCMFCGICESVCPNKGKMLTLRTGSYEWAAYERDHALYFDRERLTHAVDEYWAARGGWPEHLRPPDAADPCACILPPKKEDA
jgi:NADH-quinone oxidoreductase subunit I